MKFKLILFLLGFTGVLLSSEVLVLKPISVAPKVLTLKPVAKPVAKTVAKPVVKKPVAKPVPKAVVKPVVKKPVAKPVAKPVIKPVAKPVAKPIVQPASVVPIAKPIIADKPILKCTGGQVANSTGTACICPINETLVNGVCCEEDSYSENGKTCSTCPEGGQLSEDGKSCPCPDDKYLVNGICCDENSYSADGKTCSVCIPGGQVSADGKSCPCAISGQIIIDGACSCPIGQEVVGNSCQPIGCQGGTLTGNTCSCAIAGQVPINGVCSCPTGQTLVNGICCKTGQISDGKTCKNCTGKASADGSACLGKQQSKPVPPSAIPFAIYNNTFDSIKIFTVAIAPGYYYSTKNFPSVASGLRCPIFLPTNSNADYSVVNSAVPFTLSGQRTYKGAWAWKASYMCPSVSDPNSPSYSAVSSVVVVYSVNGQSAKTTKVFLINSNIDSFVIAFGNSMYDSYNNRLPLENSITIETAKQAGGTIAGQAGAQITTLPYIDQNTTNLAPCSADGISPLNTACGCTNYPDSSLPYAGGTCSRLDWRNNSPLVVSAAAMGGDSDASAGPIYQDSSTSTGGDIPVDPADS
ncbi:MAG: hypothetical protein P4L22_04190 [Candidatus Babeliales bacterium]|nr:hypothetical protein [Candidatus Babeliales bacterium]